MRWLLIFSFFMSTLYAMSTKDLEKWDAIVNEIDDTGKARLYAYLYTAQEEASRYSSEGSLDPVSFAVLKLFYPAIEIPQMDTDPASEKIAETVMEPLRRRFEEESRCIHSYPLSKEPYAWNPGKEPPIGINFGTWKPWFLLCVQQFRVAPPPSPSDPFWKEQIAAVKKAQEEMTKTERASIDFWAGKEGDWFKILNAYLMKQRIDLCKQLEVRSVFARAYADTMAAIFDSKYTYQVRRPFMADPSIISPIPCPNHPSYPSGHSTTSSMAASLLSYYFPTETSHWYQLAQEAGYSRICAGIHYPLDHEVGFCMGEKIASYVISTF